MDNETQVETPTHKKPGSKRAVTIGLAAGLLGGTAAGLVFGVPGFSSAASPSALVQQVDDTTDTTTNDTTTTDDDDDTTTDNTTTDDTTTDTTTDNTTDPAVEPGTRLREVLQPLVDDGTITAEQADAVTAQLVENRPERGEGGFGGGGRGHGPFGHFLVEGSAILTDLLGLDADTLREQLHDGSSLAEIATANGVEPQAVIDALMAEATTQIDQAVTDGTIDAVRAEELKADLVDRITARVNGERPERGDFPGGRHGEPDADDDVPVTTED